jgi:DNA repair exonuclease SbcCD ATPase subunit
MNRTLRLDLQKAVQSTVQRMDQIEHQFSSLPRIEARLNAMDKRSSDLEASVRQLDLENRTTQQACDARVAQLEAVKDELFALLESNRTAISRVAFDVEENNTRVSAYITGVEERINESLDATRDNTRQELSAAQARWTVATDELRRHIETKDAEAAAINRRQYASLIEELDALRRNCAQDRDGLATELRDYSDLKVSKLQHSISQSIADLRTVQNKQAGFMCDLEESLSAQLDALQSSLHGTVEEQATRHNQYIDSNTAVDAQLKEVRARVEEVAQAYRSSLWADQAPAQNLALPSGGNHYTGAEVPPPRVDASFNANLPDVQEGSQSREFSTAVNNSAGGMRPAPRVAPLPSVGVERGSSLHHVDQSVLHTEAPSTAMRQRSTSPTVAPQSTTTAARKGRLTRVARGQGDSAVDIVQKFLEIYEADQKDVSKR